MKFSFGVGEIQPRRVTFDFDQFWGHLKITVDDEDVVRDFRFLSLRLTKRYEFDVQADGAVHAVAIEKTRPLIFAGFRPQKYKAFVDDVLVKECVG